MITCCLLVEIDLNFGIKAALVNLLQRSIVKSMTLIQRSWRSWYGVNWTLSSINTALSPYMIKVGDNCFRKDLFLMDSFISVHRLSLLMFTMEFLTLNSWLMEVTWWNIKSWFLSFRVNHLFRYLTGYDSQRTKWSNLVQTASWNLNGIKILSKTGFYGPLSLASTEIIWNQLEVRTDRGPGP